MSIAPFTALVMSRTNEELIEMSEGRGFSDGNGNGKENVERNGKEVRGLLERWGKLNGVRSVLPLLGGVVGVVAVLA